MPPWYQAWYQGGISVIDFTDSSNPVEIAYFDRGPIDAEELVTGGFWSTYWYGNHIYGTEIIRGLDVLTLEASELARLECQYVQPANDLGAVNVIAVPVGRPEATRNQFLSVDRSTVEIGNLDRITRVSEVDNGNATLVPGLVPRWHFRYRLH